MITLPHLHAIMPRAGARADAAYPHLTAALAEFGISKSLLQLTMFLANVAHETGELRWMEELASGAQYEGRQDLGNVHAGDGRRYKGRGAFQLTGRANYAHYGKLLGVNLIDNPTLAATPELAYRIAGLYWMKSGCPASAEADDFEGVVRRINGGLRGLANRRGYLEKARQVLG